MANPVGLAKVVHGQVDALGPTGSRTLSEGGSIFKGDTITTAKGSASSIQFSDKSVLNIGEGSKVSIDNYVYDGTKGGALIKMAHGTFRTVTGEIVKQNPESFKMQSPLATIGIRGTETAHTIPEPGQGSENHLVMVFDGKPVIVQPLGGGAFQVLGQAGVKVEVNQFGAGPVLVMTPQEYKYFEALSARSLQQQGVPQDVVTPIGNDSKNNSASPVQSTKAAADAAQAEAAAKASAEAAAKAAADAAAKAAAEAAQSGDPGALAAAEAAAKAAADAAAKAALEAKAAAELAMKANQELFAAMQAQALFEASQQMSQQQTLSNPSTTSTTLAPGSILTLSMLEQGGLLSMEAQAEDAIAKAQAEAAAKAAAEAAAKAAADAAAKAAAEAAEKAAAEAAAKAAADAAAKAAAEAAAKAAADAAAKAAADAAAKAAADAAAEAAAKAAAAAAAEAAAKAAAEAAAKAAAEAAAKAAAEAAAKAAAEAAAKAAAEAAAKAAAEAVGGGGASSLTLDLSGLSHAAMVDLVSRMYIEQTGGQPEMQAIASTVTTVTGTDFGDTIIGSTSADTLDGGAGNDMIVGGGGVDSLYGGLGNDTISGGPQSMIVDPGIGVDVVTTGQGVDAIFMGTALNDAGGNDTINAGTGADTLYFTDNQNNSNDLDTTKGVEKAILGDAPTSITFPNPGQFSSTDWADIGNKFTLDGSAVGASDPVNNTLAFDGSQTADGAFSIIGGHGADTLIGGGQNDSIYGGDGNDSINGGNGNNLLSGQAGNDTLISGNGDDTLIGGAGADSLVGGNGNDTADYSGSTGGILVAMEDGAAMDGMGGADTLSGIENIIGSSFADDIYGDPQANSISTGDGDDSVSGGAGNDTISGGAGADSINGGSDSDSILGGAGNDTINGSTGADFINGGDGADLIAGGDANDTIEGGKGADTIDGGLGSDTFIFNAAHVDAAKTLVADAADKVQAIGSVDFRDAGAAFKDFGKLELYTSGSTVQFDRAQLNELATITFHGDFGTDGQTLKVYLDAAHNVVDSSGAIISGAINGDLLKYQGSSVGDTIIGSNWDDYIVGGAGVDSLNGGGNDNLNGAGDTLSYAEETGTANGGGIIATYGGNLVVNDTYGTNDMVSNFEHLVGTGKADTIYINASSPIASVQSIDMDGGCATPTGIDKIVFSADADMTRNSAPSELHVTGLDKLVFDAAAGTRSVTFRGDDAHEQSWILEKTGSYGAGLSIAAGMQTTVDLSGFSQGSGWNTSTDTISITGTEVADSITGSFANDLIEGMTGDDTIFGGAGNDNINGGDGNDSIDCGDGNDTIVGSAHDDNINGGAGTQDVLDYRAFSNDFGLSLDLGLGTVTYSTYSQTISNIEVVIGGQGHDELIGSSGDETFTGREGADTIDGGAGTDTLDYSREDGGSAIGVSYNSGLSSWEVQDTYGTQDVVAGIDKLILNNIN